VKIIEITIMVFFVAGMLFAMCDAENMQWFLWSKVVAAGFLGATIFLAKKLKELS